MSDESDDVLDDEETEEEPQLDPEVAARRAAALAQIRKYGDPVLTTRAVTVERFDGDLGDQLARMSLVMHEGLGIGLAATQLGILNRVLVYQLGDAPLAALVNPEIEWSGDELETLDEGCLSLPGVLVEVERSVFVRVHAQDGNGERLVIEASGLEARVIQHELDHLDGVLILDRTPRDQRRDAIKAMREAAQADDRAA